MHVIYIHTLFLYHPVPPHTYHTHTHTHSHTRVANIYFALSCSSLSSIRACVDLSTSGDAASSRCAFGTLRYAYRTRTRSAYRTRLKCLQCTCASVCLWTHWPGGAEHDPFQRSALVAATCAWPGSCSLCSPTSFPLCVDT